MVTGKILRSAISPPELSHLELFGKKETGLMIDVSSLNFSQLFSVIFPCLEDDEMSFWGWLVFRGKLLVSGRGYRFTVLYPTSRP